MSESLPPQALTVHPALQRTATFFNEFSPASLAMMGEFYTADAYFKDPFNEVNGLENIRQVFAAMYDSLNDPRFVVRDLVGSADNAVLTWDFVFSIKRYKPHRMQCIRGASHLKLDQNGRITFHRDYWDASEELYEKLPILGGLMRWVKRRFQHN